MVMRALHGQILFGSPNSFYIMKHKIKASLVVCCASGSSSMMTYYKGYDEISSSA